MTEVKADYLVLFDERGSLTVLGVVSTPEEAERLAKQRAEYYQGSCKAYVLRLSAAYVVS